MIKRFIIETLAAMCIFILYANLTLTLIIDYGNYISVILFPVLVPIMAWIYDTDL